MFGASCLLSIYLGAPLADLLPQLGLAGMLISLIIGWPLGAWLGSRSGWSLALAGLAWIGGTYLAEYYMPHPSWGYAGLQAAAVLAGAMAGLRVR